MELHLRPNLRFLDDNAIRAVVCGAYEILTAIGFAVETDEGLRLMAEAGVEVDFSRKRVKPTADLLNWALQISPRQVAVYDQIRKQKLILGGEHVHFVIDSTQISVQDFETETNRKPATRDMIDHALVVEACEHISMQAGLLLTDVPKEISDAYRLLLNLISSRKPIYATPFGREGFTVMREMTEVVAGGEVTLRKMPSHVIPCNISSPLAWSNVTGQTLIDAARAGLPALLIPIPLAGGTSPVTLAGTLAQITAENLCGLLLAQVACPGTAVIWGGGPAILDMRSGTSPMSAVESIIMGCANAEIGRYLGFPTGSNIGRTDSKRVDTQAGLETGMAFTLGALAGIHMIRGSGSLEYASVQSLEKLVIDNDICGLARRVVQGIHLSGDSLAVDLIQQLGASAEGFLSSSHTMNYFKRELQIVSPIIDRTTRSEYGRKGARDIRQRARDRVQEILRQRQPDALPREVRDELIGIVRRFAGKYGLARLPVEDLL